MSELRNARPRTTRKTLWISKRAHEAVSSMQDLLAEKSGYRPYQSETVIKGMEALRRELEQQR